MNTMATTNGEIVDMLTRSSAAMAAANNTIQETIALESAAVEITRNAETTGTAFKTLTMRIRGYDEETEELSDDLKNIAGDIADLTKINGKGGISLFTDETRQTYKSTYQILKEISEIWDQLSDKNQAQLLEKLAGKRGGQVVAGLLSNFSSAEKAMNEMANAAGSADAEMKIIESSIEYKINRFRETWVGLAQELIDRGDIGKLVDALTSLSEAISTVIDKLGLFGSLGITGGIAAGIRGYSFTNSFSSLFDGSRDRRLINKYNKGLENAIDPSQYANDFLVANANKLSDSAQAVIKNSNGAAVSLKNYTNNARSAAIATGLLNAAMNALIMWGISAAIQFAIKKIDEYNITTQEAKERVDELSSSLNSLKDEFDSLNEKQGLTPEENARLIYLEKRIKLEEKLLEIAERQRADKDLGNNKTLLHLGDIVFGEMIDKDSLDYKTKVEMGFSSEEIAWDSSSFLEEINASSNRASAIMAEVSTLINAQEDLYEKADHSGDLYAKKTTANLNEAEQAYGKLLQKYQEYEETITNIQLELTNENLTDKQRKQYEEYLRKYEDGLEKITYHINQMGITFNPEWIISPDIEFDLSDLSVSEYKNAYDEYVQKLLKFLNYHNYDKERYYSIFGTKGSIDNNPLYNQYVAVAQSAAEKFGDYTESYLNGNLSKQYDLSFIDDLATKLNIKTSEQIDLLQKSINKAETRNDIEKEYEEIYAKTLEDNIEFLDYANKKDKSKYKGFNYVDDAQSTIKQLGDTLKQLEEGTFDDSALIDLLQDFPELTDDIDNLSEAIKEKLVTSIEALEEETGKTLPQELKNSLNDLIYSAVNANRTLNESFNQIKSSVKVYKDFGKAIKENKIDESLLSSIAGLSDRLDTMVAGYYGGVVTIEELYAEVEKQRETDFENYKQAYIMKQALDEEFYEHSTKAHLEIIKYFKDVYKIDLQNFKNYQQAKQEVEKTILGQNAKLVAKYYDAQKMVYNEEWARLEEGARNGDEWANSERWKVQQLVKAYEQAIEELNKIGWQDFEDSLSGFGIDNFDKISSSLSGYKELFDFFERRIEVIDQALSKLDGNLENVNGHLSKNILIAGKIGIVSEEIKDYTSALAMYEEMANKELSKLSADLQDKIKNGAVDITQLIGESGEEVNKVLTDYQNWANKVNDCNQKLIELKETLRDLALDKFNNIVQDYTDQFDLIGSSSDLIDKQITVFEEAGQVIGRAFYESQIVASQKQRDLLEKEKAELIKELSSSISSGYIQKGTDEWLEMVNSIKEVDSSILDCDQSIEQLQNSILELSDKAFERLQNQFSDLKNQMDNINSLLDDVDVSDEEGVWSKEGLTRMGMYADQYELARHNVEKYQEQIDQLNGAYADGLYSTTEYLDKLSDLAEQQWSEALAAEEAKKSIMELNKARVDMIKQGIQKQIDKQKELVDAQKKALDQEKALRDWQNTLEEKNKNITKLQNQIAVLKNDDSAAANAKRIKLQQELNDALDDLEETQYDHSIEKQKEALDQHMEDFEDARQKEIDELEEYLKDVERVQTDSFNAIKANSDVVAQELEELVKTHGVIVSDAITASWKQGEGALASYGDALTVATSGFIAQIQTIELYLAALQDEADFTADRLVGMLSAKADNLLMEFNAARDSENDLINATNMLHNSLVTALESGYDVSRILGAFQEVREAAEETKNTINGDPNPTGKKKDENPPTTEGNKTTTNNNKYSNVHYDDYNGDGIIDNPPTSSYADINGDGITEAEKQQKRQQKNAELSKAWSNFAYKSYYDSTGLTAAYNNLSNGARSGDRYANQLKWQIDQAIKDYLAEVDRINKKYEGFANGVYNLPKSQLAWTQEHGMEAILSPTRNAILTKLNKGDTVLTKEQTDNLFKLSKIDPSTIFGNLKIQTYGTNSTPTLTIGNVLTVNGNIDDTNIAKMQAVANNAINKAFKKFSDEIIKR